MKSKLLLLLVFITTAFTACDKKGGSDTGNIIKPVTLTVNVGTERVNDVQVPLADAVITIINKANNSTYTATTNENGVATFESLTPGTYNINASLQIAASVYNQLSGEQVEDDLSFNQSLDNISVMEDKAIDMQLVAATIGNWVFKQIYYAGSNTSDGASFRDVFVEIYNNSNDTLYADSLCFAQAFGRMSTSAQSDYVLSNLQYDWSRSLNMNAAGNANEDYTYAKGIFMIPSDGTGKAHPVAPGASVIIAATAINHTQPYVMNNGVSQNVNNPALTIDLSGADFDCYLVPYLQSLDPTSEAYKWDLNNPLVAKVSVIHSTGQKDLVMDALGRESYILFKAPNPANLPGYARPDVREIVSSTNLYKQVPNKYVIDGVEIQHPIAASRMPRRLSNTIDAGATNVPGGQYSGQSLVRKTKKVLSDGRRVLQDTNNSANDFGHLIKADPSKGPSSFVN